MILQAKCLKLYVESNEVNRLINDHDECCTNSMFYSLQQNIPLSAPLFTNKQKNSSKNIILSASPR